VRATCSKAVSTSLTSAVRALRRAVRSRSTCEAQNNVTVTTTETRATDDVLTEAHACSSLQTVASRRQHDSPSTGHFHCCPNVAVGWQTAVAPGCCTGVALTATHTTSSTTWPKYRPAARGPARGPLPRAGLPIPPTGAGRSSRRRWVSAEPRVNSERRRRSCLRRGAVQRCRRAGSGGACRRRARRRSRVGRGTPA
jgi:hypothetical protein